MIMLIIIMIIIVIIIDNDSFVIGFVCKMFAPFQAWLCCGELETLFRPLRGLRESLGAHSRQWQEYFKVKSHTKMFSYYAFVGMLWKSRNFDTIQASTRMQRFLKTF